MPTGLTWPSRSNSPLRTSVQPSRPWSGRQDLNLRPPAPKAGALPNCATPRSTQAYRDRLNYRRAPTTGRTRV
jgi:hypothetical protein